METRTARTVAVSTPDGRLMPEFCVMELRVQLEIFQCKFCRKAA